jgi:hypothetical protein
VICVYTYDYEEKAIMMRIRSALCNLGIRREIIYKPDEDTHRLRDGSDYTPNIGHDSLKGRTNMALILYPDGTSKEVHPANGDHFELEELTQIVGGMIQMIPLSDGRIMTLNEEGRPDAEAGVAGLPRNEQATALAGFPSTEGPLATLRGLGVEQPFYAVGPLDLAYIPGTVLVSTKYEVSWTE